MNRGPTTSRAVPFGVPPRFFLALLLVLMTSAVYARVGSFGLVWDDRDYVSGNAHVLSGLTREGVAWAFSSFAEANWHPLTWISLMADVSLFGRSSGAHHLVNVLLHATNAALLFLVLARLTGTLWPGWFTAALFALHPIHVESVAWVTERKDVLSVFFALLTVAAHLWHARRRRPLRYAAVVAAFALGLMAKPMLVSLPFVLLLLDFWPLGRIPGSPVPRGAAPPRSRIGDAAAVLLAEKLPLLALAAVSGAITLVAQQRFQAVQSLYSHPLSVRMANALEAYALYLGKAVWPRALAVFYPYAAGTLFSWRVGAATLLLAAISVLAVLNLRQRPALPVGWFWYLGTLVPVIGLVQVGSQGLADRYAYLPFLGVYLALAWSIHGLTKNRPHRGAILAAAGMLALGAFASLTLRQVGYWRDETSLYGQTLRVTRDNKLVHYNLACTLLEQGKTEAAVSHLRAALRTDPFYVEALANLGAALLKTGEAVEAKPYFERVLQIKPDDPTALVNLGRILGDQGRRDEAIQHFRRAIGIAPRLPEAHLNLGNALDEEGRHDEAVTAYREALRIRPDNATAHYNLGITLARQGRREEAADRFREALRLQPDFAEARRSLESLRTAP